ncbi:response regulator [Solidesulfovibrio magneticus]|uniref:Response regulator receiver protein n=1 Tax=Solidesulfovibrio magneticus (strain ATCC 700980 / DSM 13731 / RS-1) TaxID=573370 RepID=C4XLR0_SOLM1|nr:response regulator [Solidesulfovibrio magneticus]BAH74648.1 response regulator receiver protein [Solidesulfovibrio magneticus RS-1]
MEPATAPPRLLLVDDNRDNLALIRLYLESDHYRIDEAENGVQAVELFAAAPYDLVLMDLEMPVVDGYEATRRIRALERQRGAVPTPILALTAHALDEHRLLCQQAGFTDFLAKPVRKAAVLRTLLHYLGPEGESAEPTKPRPPNTDAPNPGRLAALLPLFYDLASQTLDAARTALDQGDLDQARRQSHKLKGSAGSYGFPELAKAAAALERAADAGNAKAAAAARDWAAALLAKARLDWPV